MTFHSPDALCAIEQRCFSLYNTITMEQHPVPQNVTTFQFRLIGDMTIKQFGYLAGGIVAAYICYKLPLPFFFTWPLAGAAGLLGFGLAFVPVEERPMDIWIASFFRNTYSPTQWVWQKERVVPAAAPQQPIIHHPPGPTTAVSKRASQQVAPSATHPIHEAGSKTGTVRPRQARPDIFGWLMGFFRDKPGVHSLPPTYTFADRLAAAHKQPTSPAPAAVPAPRPPPPKPREESVPTGHLAEGITNDHRVASLQEQLSDMMRERERLEKELVSMRQKADQLSRAAPPQPMRQAAMVTPPPPQSGPTVRVIAPVAAKNAGIARLTTFPNVVTGIIKDQFGNLLAGMLITVNDRDGVPQRALKTNRLGQFAASTPLPDATYIVEIEDPKGGFTFDKAQIQLNGSVAPPLEITAKSQKQIDRDKLAREIFGNQQNEFTLTKSQ